jgi:2-oxoacid:acceptor oxidoreductase delta subunit (pyruvate/2-ketoisovalerate family)
MEENPLPSICGRVCDHPCEEACNRRGFDEPLAIKALERFVGDHGLEAEIAVTNPKAIRKERIAVVGSGPAGLSCAYYLRQLGYGVKVFERRPLAGGMLRWGIPDYRLPQAVLNGEIERFRRMGIEIVPHTSLDLDTESINECLTEFKAIFLAMGAQKELRLGIVGENLPGVLSGLDFLRMVKEGEKPRLGERVTVVGGGNTAVDVARTVLRLGAKPTLIYRRARSEMPAVPNEVEAALKEGVWIKFLTSPVAIARSRDRGLQLECVRHFMGKLGLDKRRTVVPREKSNFLIESDTVIVAIGETVDRDGLPEFLELTDRRVAVDEWGTTVQSGVFVGGDLSNKHRTVSHAIGSGKRAALAIDSFVGKRRRGSERPLFLGKGGSLSIASWTTSPRAIHRSTEVVQYNNLNWCYFEPAAKKRIPQILDLTKRRRSFHEVNLGLSENQALEEAEHCLQCGTCSFCENCYTFCPDSAVWKKDRDEMFEIDYDFCKGCGICAHECPSHHIEMVREEK